MIQDQHEQNLRDLALIREDPGWALAMVQRVRRYDEALRWIQANTGEPDAQAIADDVLKGRP